MSMQHHEYTYSQKLAYIRQWSKDQTLIKFEDAEAADRVGYARVLGNCDIGLTGKVLNMKTRQFSKATPIAWGLVIRPMTAHETLSLLNVAPLMFARSEA